MWCCSDASVTSTIQDALDQFFQSETIEYTCESCEHKQVLVSHKFYRLPRCVCDVDRQKILEIIHRRLLLLTLISLNCSVSALIAINSCVLFFRVLVLHLKRYHFSNMFTSSRKISRDVLIPRFLTLAEHSTEHTYPAYNIDIARRNRCVRAASRAPRDRSVEKLLQIPCATVK